MKAAVIFCALALFLFLPTESYASGELADLYDTFPNEVTDQFPSELGDELKRDDGTSALSLLDASFFLPFLGETLSRALSDSAKTLLALEGAVLLCSLLSSLSKDNSGIAKTMSFSSSLCLCTSCIAVIKPLCDTCLETVNVISGIIKTSLPIMTSIALASGQVNASFANATFLNAVLALTEEVGKEILSPIIAVSLAFTAVSSLSRGSSIDLSNMVSSIKKIFIFFASLFSFVLCLTLAFQTVIAKGSDSVLLRSIKFASGSSVPIVGSALSEAAGSYLSGLSLIKSSAGGLIAAAIALVTLPMLIKLFAVKICLTFVAFTCDLLGVNGSSVRDFEAINDMLIAILVTSSMIFVISMGIFASSLPSI
jgi:stage III sporulation protein AE